jgi:hypothetical protein
MWTKLTGKLDQETVQKSSAVAVKYFNGKTDIKETTKDMLWKYDLSSVIMEYRIL